MMSQPLDLILALLDDGQPDKALEAAHRLYQSQPKDALVNYGCAICHDVLGQEREAVPYYEYALAQRLAGAERRIALLGLGSSYRVLGEHN